ncbi:ornithine cyclodeaminase [Caldiplasma sukawensis]
MIYITEEMVQKNLDYKELSNSLRSAFTDVSSQEAGISPRHRLFTGDGILNTMPGHWRKKGIMGLKTYVATESGVHFVVIVFSSEKPENMFVIEANLLGQRRTGALPAMVTEIIRNTGFSYLIIGSGFQAQSQLEAMYEICKPSEVAVFSRNSNHSEEFAKKYSEKLKTKISVITDKRDFSSFDVISSATDTRDPIITEDVLGNSFHLNLVGANLLNRREASKMVMDSAETVIVEDIKQCQLESAEISEMTNKNNIVELSEFLRDTNKFKGKRTILKTLGTGLEDIAAAYVLIKKLGYQI